jgi:hypothetical protein
MVGSGFEIGHVNLPELPGPVVGLVRFFLKHRGIEHLEQFSLDNGWIHGKSKDYQQLKDQNVSKVQGHRIDVH